METFLGAAIFAIGVELLTLAVVVMVGTWIVMVGLVMGLKKVISFIHVNGERTVKRLLKQHAERADRSKDEDIK